MLPVGKILEIFRLLDPDLTSDLQVILRCDVLSVNNNKLTKCSKHIILGTDIFWLDITSFESWYFF